MVSRPVDSLIRAPIVIILVGAGSLAGALVVGVRSLGVVALSEAASARIRRRLA